MPSNSTARRLLSTLRDNDYLRQQEGSRRYEAGPAALRRDVNETVNLQVLVGNEVFTTTTPPKTS